MWEDTLRPVEKSQTLLLNEQSRSLEDTGREVFKFGFGQSPFPPLDAATEALRAHAGSKEYTPVQGLPELRARVASFHSAADRIDIGPEQVLVAPGSKSLIYSVLASFRHADVLIPTPAWVSYEPQARLLGHTPLRVTTSFEQRWRVEAEAIDSAMRQKADRSVPSVLILNHPGNPEGLGYSDDELRAIASACRMHDILVVSDEIYGLLDHAGEHVSLARHYPEGTIVTGGLSKWCGAGGWRLGVAVLPTALLRDFKDTMLGVASETYSCAPTPVQRAACEAYVWNEATTSYLRHQRRLLSALGQRVAAELTRAGVRVHAPTGGFYLLPDFSEHTDALARRGVRTASQLCTQLLADTGVALLPGDSFGLSPARLCARLAYVDFDGRQALKASREIGLATPLDDAAMQALFDKTLRGIRKLTQWLAAL